MLEGFKHLVAKASKEDPQIANYKEMLQKKPNDVNIRLKLGDLYAKNGDKQAAIQEYTAAAIHYANDGFLVKAIAVNKIIVRLDPSRKEALDRLSDLYFQRGLAADPDVENYRKSLQQEHLHAQTASESSVPEIQLNAAPGVAAPNAHSPINLNKTKDDTAEILPLLKQVPLLANLPEDDMLWLKKHAAVHHIAAQAEIATKEKIHDSLFIILQGSVKLLTRDKENQETLLDKLERGGFFGASSLFAPVRQVSADTPHLDFKAIAETPAFLWEIPKETLVLLTKKQPDISETLLMEYYKQKASDVTLARVPLFSYLDPHERRKIAEHLTPATVKKGDTIITEGEVGDSMYIIKSGQVGIYTTLMEDESVSVIKTDQERLHLATLQDGDFFGEQALITNEPRSATVIALSDIQLLKFTKHDLALVLKQYPRVGALLKKYHQQRITDTMESLKSIW